MNVQRTWGNTWRSHRGKYKHQEMRNDTPHQRIRRTEPPDQGMRTVRSTWMVVSKVRRSFESGESISNRDTGIPNSGQKDDEEYRKLLMKSARYRKRGTESMWEIRGEKYNARGTVGVRKLAGYT